MMMRSHATWISRATGEQWELPTDREWAYAANESFASDVTTSLQGADYADIWLARYEEETSGRTDVNAVPRTIGSFGINRNGVADMGGNVWEWTSTCYRRIHVDDAGRTIADEPSCGIRILDGRHRAPMSYFIRDARSGGCSVGVPPDNLGFRLVRRNGLMDRVRQALGWGD
jgi:formylglycine-generating enzyme required for sulfatase activity